MIHYAWIVAYSEVIVRPDLLGGKLESCWGYLMCVRSLTNLGALTPFVALGEVETGSVRKPHLFR